MTDNTTIAADSMHGFAARRRLLLRVVLAKPGVSVALLSALYVVATVATDAFFMADTADYVASVVRGVEFWEFGHLVWRPLGWLLLTASALALGSVPGGDTEASATLVFMTLNWIAGLACVLLLRAIIARVTGRSVIAAAAAGVFLFTTAFINFSQTGASYVPGLAFLLLGMHLLIPDNDERLSPGRGILAGLALAGSLLMWVPYLWAMPAALLSPLLLRGWSRERLRMSVIAALACAAAVMLAYGAVLVHLRLYNYADIKEWIRASSHGVTLGGVSRVGFGLPRSFVNMGNDGVLFKRFLAGDPLNPVSAVDLLRMSLWKLILFYAGAVVMIGSLVRSRGVRRFLLFFFAAAVPVIGFAISFDGGTPERYLPLYPAVFICVSAALAGSASLPGARFVLGALAAVIIVSNVSAMTKWNLESRNAATLDRLSGLEARLQPDSWLLVVTQSDDLGNLDRSSPLQQPAILKELRVSAVISMGSEQAATWKNDTARFVIEKWDEGGDVWVSTRLLRPVPEPSWNWVEGDDPNVSWNDLYSVFSALEYGEWIGGPDGFVLLNPSRSNREALERLSRRPGTARFQRALTAESHWAAS